MILTEPTINIAFTQQAKDSLERSKRGIVALILKDAATLATRNYTIYSESDIPSNLKDSNKEQIRLALMGNINTPSKVEVYVLEADAEDLDDALNYFLVNQFIYMAVPEATEKELESLTTWIKNQRDIEKRHSCKLIISTETDCDHEGIINFTTDITANDTEYLATQYCSRIAGLLAGTPITQSATYAKLDEATGCTTLSKAERNTAVGSGKLIAFWDGEKVKLNRAVNTLTTTTDVKGDAYKKIKIVEAMDMIKDDLTKLTEDNYFGKYENTYDNRCILLSAICDYFKALGSTIQSYTVDFDIEAIKTYIKNNISSLDVDTMKDAELLRVNTGTNVFLKGRISISDTIEDLQLQLVMEQ